MKRGFKKYILSAVAVFLLTGSAVIAQEKEDLKKERKESREEFKRQQRDLKDGEKNRKLREYDEIVIKKKNNSDANTKIVIEIKDDQVTIDGRPIEDFVNDEVAVLQRSAMRYRLDQPGSAFRVEKGWVPDGDENRAFLGVMTEGSSSGAKVLNVSKDSPAEKAGLKKDDIITRINDTDVFDHEQLSSTISSFKPEEKVAISYKRNGKENKVTATLGSRPRTRTIYGGPDAPAPPVPPMPPLEFNFDNGDFNKAFGFRSAKPKLGIQAQDTEDGKGVKVLSVYNNSAADKAGIRTDDIITSFDGKEVNSATELAKISREVKDKSSFKVQLKRNGKSQSVEIKIPKILKTAEL